MKDGMCVSMCVCVCVCVHLTATEPPENRHIPQELIFCYSLL